MGGRWIQQAETPWTKQLRGQQPKGGHKPNAESRRSTKSCVPNLFPMDIKSWLKVDDHPQSLHHWVLHIIPEKSMSCPRLNLPCARTLASGVSEMFNLECKPNSAMINRELNWTSWAEQYSMIPNRKWQHMVVVGHKLCFSNCCTRRAYHAPRSNKEKNMKTHSRISCIHLHASFSHTA